ncbi:hypothetical protein [Thalassotalea aquiviva]|uniref:hypothetical protein n=1 Tax=Thalassotalea aquiviva TaxID=3242415 RepID=UPI00352B9207
MKHRALSEVGVRLEKAFQEHVTPDMTPTDKYELYELIAIQILDSEFDNFGEGQLEEYLSNFLDRKQRTLLI